MKYMVYVIVALFGLLPGLAAGQEQPPPYCENNPHFDDFDFWVGHWKVYSRADNRYQGENHIRKLHQACLIEEKWQSASGGTGTSLNYYNPRKDIWRQVWVANGYSLDITGGLNEEGAMVLEGTIDYYRQDKSFPFRGTWTPKADGSVRQHFQQYDPEKQTWVDWFDGRYIKADAKQPSDSKDD